MTLLYKTPFYQLVRIKSMFLGQRYCRYAAFRNTTLEKIAELLEPLVPPTCIARVVTFSL